MRTKKALLERDINNKITVLGHLEEDVLVCYRCDDVKGSGGDTVTVVVGEKCSHCEGRTAKTGDGFRTDGGWHYPTGVELMALTVEPNPHAIYALAINHTCNRINVSDKVREMLLKENPYDE